MANARDVGPDHRRQADGEHEEERPDKLGGQLAGHARGGSGGHPKVPRRALGPRPLAGAVGGERRGRGAQRSGSAPRAAPTFPPLATPASRAPAGSARATRQPPDPPHGQRPLQDRRLLRRPRHGLPPRPVRAAVLLLRRRGLVHRRARAARGGPRRRPTRARLQPRRRVRARGDGPGRARPVRPVPHDGPAAAGGGPGVREAGREHRVQGLRRGPQPDRDGAPAVPRQAQRLGPPLPRAPRARDVVPLRAAQGPPLGGLGRGPAPGRGRPHGVRRGPDDGRDVGARPPLARRRGRQAGDLRRRRPPGHPRRRAPGRRPLRGAEPVRVAGRAGGRATSAPRSRSRTRCWAGPGTGRPRPSASWPCSRRTSPSCGS